MYFTNLVPLVSTIEEEKLKDLLFTWGRHIETTLAQNHGLVVVFVPSALPFSDDSKCTGTVAPKGQSPPTMQALSQATNLSDTNFTKFTDIWHYCDINIFPHAVLHHVVFGLRTCLSLGIP